VNTDNRANGPVSQRVPTRAADLVADITGLVLVVDDDARNRKLLHDLLAFRGHQIVEAADGHSAIEQALKTKPDVILLDVLMPDMNGFEVCVALRANLELAATPILFITALADREHRLKAIEAGANDFLTKPIDSRDVTLRVRNAIRMKRLFTELQKANENLRELEKLRDRMLHWIVHDMKAPIGGISGYLELLLMEAQDRLTTEQAGYIQEALRSARRLINMANTLLDVARLEDRQMPLRPAATDLVAVVREVVAELGGVAGERNVRMDIPSGELWVMADAEVIRRVISNLLDNALRVVPHGGLIRVTAVREGEQLRLEVTDNGPGIPEELHGQLFEKFGMVGVEVGKKPYSTGLGLHFSKLALEAMGGRIGVISKVGEGSTFWFVLPSASKPAPSP
jgi:two-component system sensor histidine kinase/response regulator